MVMGGLPGLLGLHKLVAACGILVALVDGHSPYFAHTLLGTPTKVHKNIIVTVFGTPNNYWHSTLTVSQCSVCPMSQRGTPLCH